jgi:hypothetical protein
MQAFRFWKRRCNVVARGATVAAAASCEPPPTRVHDRGLSEPWWPLTWVALTNSERQEFASQSTPAPLDDPVRRAFHATTHATLPG